MLATLVKYATDEAELRVLYQYLAEGSVVFPKVFPVMYVGCLELGSVTCRLNCFGFPQSLPAGSEGEQRAQRVQRSDCTGVGSEYYTEHAGNRRRLPAAVALFAELRIWRLVAFRRTVYQG